jgi:hypothetical protein
MAGGPVGSLNVYRSDAYHWDDSDTAATEAFAGIVSQLLVTALMADRQDTIVAQLQRALDARVIIERAVGVLIAVEGLDAPAAFERLRRVARSSRSRAADVAARVVEMRGFPPE